MNETIAIIGAGNMGSAFAKRLAEAQPELRIHLCDHNLEKLDTSDAKHVFTDPLKAIDSASTILLAVKPQSAHDLIKSLPLLTDRLVISIMAGISVESLMTMTSSKMIIRAMPNLPAQAGQGLTGWIASAQTTAKQRAFAKQLFTSVGQEIELKKESLMDSLTPLSGSGPAYFFLLADLLSAKAIQEGFSPEDAELIARQTLIGSAEILAQGSRTPSEWIAAVASKGGVTEAALRVLKESHLDTIFSDAIDKAITRSRELNA